MLIILQWEEQLCKSKFLHLFNALNFLGKTIYNQELGMSMESEQRELCWKNIIRNKYPPDAENLTTKVGKKENNFILG